jgi:hypothetical protein
LNPRFFPEKFMGSIGGLLGLFFCGKQAKNSRSASTHPRGEDRGLFF